MKKSTLSCFVVSFCLFLIGTTAVFGQKKVLGKPELFKLPVDYFGKPDSYEKFLRVGTKNKEKDNAWLVFSDRDRNNVYEKPSTSSSVTGTLGFRDFCYVVDENEDWIQVVDASIDKLKIVNLKRTLGWVPKKKMLLWNSSVVQLGTNIHRKVLLLNRADDIVKILKDPEKEIVPFFKGPETGEKEVDRKIFEFYFVMKKENGRSLLCEESEISPYSLDKIIGWVEERRCSPWDNRICLEPNFTPEGFAERKANPKIQLKAFNTEEAAKGYAEQGVEDRKELFWKDDAVLVKRDKLAKSNPNRFNGNVIRFPMLSSESMRNSNDQFAYFRSGIIGSIKIRRDGSSNASFDSEITEVDYSLLNEAVAKMGQRTDNVNIFFVIEGTDSTYGFKNSIIQSMRAINADLGTGVPNLNYGALVYRDIPEANRITEFTSLSKDFEKVVNFVDRAEFRNYSDRDAYTALYYGVKQAISQAGFKEDQLNIIIMIGSYGDFRVDKDRKAKAQKERNPALVDDLTPLFENLTKIDAHLYAVQLRNEGNRPGDAFSKQGQYLILESAKYAYNKFYGNRTNPKSNELLNKLSQEHQIQVGEPSMADIFEGDNIPLVGGRFPGRLIKPAIGRHLAPSELAQAIKSDVKESIDFERILKTIVNQIYRVGDAANVKEIESELNVDIGPYMPAFADMLNKILIEGNVTPSQVHESLGDKFKLYTEVYLPYFFQGAKNPATSFVLFMPESELIDYKRSIERLLNAGSESSSSKRREKMYETYIELIAQFSGELDLRKRMDDITNDELTQLMNGLYGSGLKLNVQLDFRVGDLRDEKKVSNDEIEALMRRFKEVLAKLNAAERAGENYDFCYKSESGNRYYWIALDDAF